MISTVAMKVGRKTHKLKLSVMAQLSLEKETGKPIGELLDGLLTGSGGLTLIKSALAACMDDGKGVDDDAALAVLVEMDGAPAVIPFLAKVIEEAFPAQNSDAEGETSEPASGNAKSPSKV